MTSSHPGDPNGIYPVLYPPADTVIDPNARPVEERMLRTMFREYDPDARGNRKSDATVTVTLQFVLLRIQDLVGASWWVVSGPSDKKHPFLQPDI